MCDIYFFPPTLIMVNPSSTEISCLLDDSVVTANGSAENSVILPCSLSYGRMNGVCRMVNYWDELIQFCPGSPMFSLGFSHFLNPITPFPLITVSGLVTLLATGTNISPPPYASNSSAVEFDLQLGILVFQCNDNHYLPHGRTSITFGYSQPEWNITQSATCSCE